jgi:hypothetical protein
MLRKTLNLLLISVALSSCTGLVDQFKNKTWEGQLVRYDDLKVLSAVRLKFTDDTLYIFSNAIFGAGNDTLIIQSVNKKDSSMVLKNHIGGIITINFDYRDDNNKERLMINGQDYFIHLIKSKVDISQPGALDFYKDYSVPIEAYMYLNGAYEGGMQMESQMQNIVLAQIGGIGMKLVFMDNFKVKAFSKSFFLEMFGGGGQKPEISTYHIKGNKLYFGNDKDFAFEVRNNGKTLVKQTDDMNIILNKVY